MAIAKYIVHTINENTYIIEEKLLSNQLCYLLCGKEKALLIDTGMGFKGLKETVSSLTGLPVMAANTHGHRDHIGGNHLFGDSWLHEDDKLVFKLHTDPAFTDKLVKEVLPPPLRIIFGRLVRRILKADTSGNYHYFQDGHVFHLGGRDVTVIHTPGHSPGSVCFLDQEARILFSGDTLCEWGILLHLDGCCSPEIYLESVRRLKNLSEDFDTIYPGHHGFPIDKGYIDEYLNCARHIVDGTAALTTDKGRLCNKEGRILITVSPEMKKDKH